MSVTEMLSDKKKNKNAEGTENAYHACVCDVRVQKLYCLVESVYRYQARTTQDLRLFRLELRTPLYATDSMLPELRVKL